MAFAASGQSHMLHAAVLALWLWGAVVHVGATCRTRFTFPASAGPLTGGSCPAGFPTKYDKVSPPVCYGSCPIGFAAAGSKYELCVTDCPFGYKAYDATRCTPTAGRCPAGYDLMTVLGQDLCAQQCTSGFVPFGPEKLSCASSCGSLPLSADGLSCVIGAGQSYQRIITSRATQAAAALISRATLPRPVAALVGGSCASGYVPMNGQCLLGCPGIGNYQFSYDPISRTTTCATGTCPSGGLLCGDYCIPGSEAVLLSAGACASMSRVLYGLPCEPRTCYCHLSQLPSSSKIFAALASTT